MCLPLRAPPRRQRRRRLASGTSRLSKPLVEWQSSTHLPRWIFGTAEQAQALPRCDRVSLRYDTRRRLHPRPKLCSRWVGTYPSRLRCPSRRPDKSSASASSRRARVPHPPGRTSQSTRGAPAKAWSGSTVKPPVAIPADRDRPTVKTLKGAMSSERRDSGLGPSRVRENTSNGPAKSKISAWRCAPRGRARDPAARCDVSEA
jgi:hypothetical protein